MATDTTGGVVVVCHKPGCPALYCFDLLDVVLGMWVPYCRCIFYLRPYEGLIALVLDGGWT